MLTSMKLVVLSRWLVMEPVVRSCIWGISGADAPGRGGILLRQGLPAAGRCRICSKSRSSVPGHFGSWEVAETRGVFGVVVALGLAAGPGLKIEAQAPAQSPAGRGVRVEVTVPAAVRSEPVTGRVYVMVARTNEREPRLQIGRTGT